MNTKIKTILGIAIFAAFLCIVYFAYSALSDNYKPSNEIQSTEDTPKQEDEKFPAPDFTVFNAQGNEVNLSDFAGTPVVLNFWASWCPPCKSEMPHFNKVYAEVKDNIAFMMVDAVDGQRETQAKGQMYIAEQGYSFPIYFDNEQDAAYAYGISSIPTTLFIDADGNIITAYQGAIDEETLRTAINLIRE
ncbi:TlpA family protein disulfide reductase [Desulfolucanica intricata]|uniref:TlpA family protein disulfide reductase n=1 Tax=Desulfolucanica intricata TaxID=1285191 RepID=UPI00082A1617|nr:TlpA disulfide reductase family protein [Desulfolucanica intricata]